MAQQAYGSAGWRKANDLMSYMDGNNWQMQLACEDTYVVLTFTRGDMTVRLQWLAEGRLMATRRLIAEGRDTTSFTVAYAKRFMLERSWV